MAHETLSPSKSPRWRACPGSVREEAAYPDERSSAAAIDGTHTHTLLAKCIDMAFMPAQMFVGMELEDQNGKFVVDPDRAERVQFALDFILTRGGKVLSERRVDPELLVGYKGLAGTADITIIGDDLVEIWDYKDGVSEVDPNTPQLEQYGFGVLAGLASSNPPNYITLGIIQPKLRTKGLPGVAFVTKTVREFLDGLPKLKADIEATLYSNAPLIAGDHCHYCKHKPNCVAVNAVVAQVFPDLTQAITPQDKIRMLIEREKMIVDLIDSAKKEALRLAEIGQPIDGIKVVRGRGGREWAVPEEKVLAFLKKAGVPSDDCYTRNVVSPAQAEKLKWIKRDGSTHELSDKHKTQMQTELINKNEGSLTVVPAADKRPAVQLSVASMFAAIPAELNH